MAVCLDVNLGVLYCTSVYLGAQEVEASSVGAQVDVRIVRAQQAKFVGVAPGRGTVHLSRNKQPATAAASHGAGTVKAILRLLLAETNRIYTKVCL